MKKQGIQAVAGQDGISPDELYTRAVTLYQAGNTAEAQAIAENLLASYPKNVYVLNLLGIIGIQHGDFIQSAKWLEKAVALNPNFAEAHNNHGFALHHLKRYKDALRSYGKAIALNPAYVEAYKNRAMSHFSLEQYAEALKDYDHLLTLLPQNAEIYNDRGLILAKLKRYDEAITHYNKAITLQPALAKAYDNRGSVLDTLKRYDEALKDYDKAIALHPAFDIAYSNRGITFYNLKRYDEALASYDKAIAINPGSDMAYNNRGEALAALNQYTEALEAYGKAIALNPKLAKAYDNHGTALYNLKRYGEALKDYNKAIAISPDSDSAHNNRGIALAAMRRYSEALEDYDKAITLNPELETAYNNRGEAFAALKRHREALENQNKAIAVNPSYADAYWNKSLIKLVQGEFEEGWKLYEWRHQKSDVDKQNARIFKTPLWLGKEQLAGKTILLYPEQGLGDNIQFCRYLPMVEAIGAKVILEAPPALVGLLSTLKGNYTLLKQGTATEFDFHCPLMSLPLAFGTLLNTIPADVPYLFADPEKEKYWKERLGAKQKTRVGLVWSGGAKHTNDHNRSIPLKTLAPLLARDCNFFSLQKEIRPEDKAMLDNNPIISFADELKDFTDTAALISQMDVVISVDTSVAHLAGAMGKKLWVLLPFAPDFRWLLEREDSPWYPTARLFRQPALGDWDSVVDRVKTEL